MNICKEEYESKLHTAITLGKFDGIHLGHGELLVELKRQKEKGMSTLLFTFSKSPQVYLNQTEEVSIFSKEEKMDFFNQIPWIDNYYEVQVTKEFLDLEPEEFVKKYLVDKFRVKHVIVGEDFRFGHNKKGDVSLLKELGDVYHYTVTSIKKIKKQKVEISSTDVRKILEQGEMKKANKILGHPFYLMGTVLHGRRLATELGFPTANVEYPKEKIQIPFGVYATKIEVEGNFFHGITNVGTKPTVTEEKKVLAESYLFDFKGEIYGKQIKIYFYEFLRPELKFETIGHLKIQMQQDVEKAKIICHGNDGFQEY